MEFSRPVVLVHGAWHGAWCWATFQAELDRRGITSYAIDLPGHGTSLEPLGGLDQDAAHLATILDHLDLTDAVLVGHSYGGAVITQAAAGRSDLAHLVYVTAFALNAGESVMGALRSLDPHDVDLGAAMQFHSDGTSTLDPRLAVAALYGSCSPEAIAAALPRLSPQPGATMTASQRHLFDLCPMSAGPCNPPRTPGRVRSQVHGTVRPRHRPLALRQHASCAG